MANDDMRVIPWQQFISYHEDILNGIGEAQEHQLPEFNNAGEDNGKVLTIDDNAVAWATPSGGDSLPDYANSYPGYTLTIGENSNTGEKYLNWTNSIPSYSIDDLGKALMITDVSGQGSLTWESPIPVAYSEGMILTAVEENSQIKPEWREPQTDLPDYENEDTGKVLKIYENSETKELIWDSVFPDYSYAHHGDVLKINAEDEYNKTVEWDSVLPDYSYQDGHVLTVNNNSLDWTSLAIPEFDENNDTGKALIVKDNNGTPEIAWDFILPDYTSSGNGSVLTAAWDNNYNEWRLTWEILLPQYDPDYDRNKTLVISNSGELIWVDYKILFPPCSSTDAGKVLSVNSSGDLEWVMPS